MSPFAREKKCILLEPEDSQTDAGSRKLFLLFTWTLIPTFQERVAFLHVIAFHKSIGNLFYLMIHHYYK